MTAGTISMTVAEERSAPNGRDCKTKRQDRPRAAATARHEYYRPVDEERAYRSIRRMVLRLYRQS
jgi:hypothetical protein